MTTQYTYRPEPIITLAHELYKRANEIVRIARILGVILGGLVGLSISPLFSSPSPLTSGLYALLTILLISLGAVIGLVVGNIAAQGTAIILRAQAAMLLLLVTVEANTRHLVDIEKRLQQSQR